MGKKKKQTLKVVHLNLDAVVTETSKWDSIKFSQDETTSEWSDKVNKLVMKNPTKMMQMQAITDDDELIIFLRENYGTFLGKYTKDFSIKNYNKTLKQKFNTKLELAFLTSRYIKQRTKAEVEKLGKPLNLNVSLTIATNSGKTKPYHIILEDVPHEYYSEKEETYYVTEEVLEALYHLYTINLMTTSKVKYDLDLTKTLNNSPFTDLDKGYVILGANKESIEISDTFGDSYYQYSNLKVIEQQDVEVIYKDEKYKVSALELQDKNDIIYGLTLEDGIEFLKAINKI